MQVRVITHDQLLRYRHNDLAVLKILRRFPHENLPVPMTATDPTPSSLGFVVFPGYHGSIHSRICESGPLNELHVARIIAELSSALSHCHAHGVVLTDIKISKIHFKEDRVSVVIADLDGAHLYDATRPMDGERKGSPNYIAPEIITQLFHDPAKADVWMLGICAFTMLCGKYPFQHDDQQEHCRRIANEELVFPAAFPERMKPILMRILTKKPEHRPTANQVAVPMAKFLTVQKRKRESVSSSEPASRSSSLTKETPALPDLSSPATTPLQFTSRTSPTGDAVKPAITTGALTTTRRQDTLRDGSTAEIIISPEDSSTLVNSMLLEQPTPASDASPYPIAWQAAESTCQPRPRQSERAPIISCIMSSKSLRPSMHSHTKSQRLK